MESWRRELRIDVVVADPLAQQIQEASANGEPLDCGALGKMLVTEVYTEAGSEGSLHLMVTMHAVRESSIPLELTRGHGFGNE